ncbi:hypothetical protein [Ancylobacter polymorphus]|uniref:Uncharacterized protein n=1 Tax=Ancylobacter polymorphus TaxID=223390 RepID=A0ABU0BGJ4_9HYPH|nr:hypothetical protein [Ancylobacter polymorphus]MDQ0304911.1 hypothetical protein [Ancylobacter polymorphus]
MPLGCKRRKLRTIALKESARLGGLAATEEAVARLQLRDEGRHPPRDLTIDPVELTLDLTARLLHAGEFSEAIGPRGHVTTLPLQPMKLDGPP